MTPAAAQIFWVLIETPYIVIERVSWRYVLTAWTFDQVKRTLRNLFSFVFPLDFARFLAASQMYDAPAVGQSLEQLQLGQSLVNMKHFEAALQYSMCAHGLMDNGKKKLHDTQNLSWRSKCTLHLFPYKVQSLWLITSLVVAPSDPVFYISEQPRAVREQISPESYSLSSSTALFTNHISR